jgi:dienelactone hydrolase
MQVDLAHATLYHAVCWRCRDPPDVSSFTGSAVLSVDLSNLKSLSDWPAVREDIEKKARDLIQTLPPERPDPQVKVMDETSFPLFVRKRINYFVDEWERVSAWLFVPEDREDTPGILCCHQTVPQGKDEPAGIEGDRRYAFARHFAELGYMTLAPDCITAGERVAPGMAPYDTRLFYKDHPRMSAMGKMLVDHLQAVSVLRAVNGVDPERIGVIGHSLGGYNALFLTAFDKRVQVCVVSCGFTRFADDAEPERWVRNEGFVHFPKLRKAIEDKDFPFDWEHILALAAPTPTLLLTALNDEIFSNTESCEKAAEIARRIYSLLGAEQALCNVTHKSGHGLPPRCLERADDWFERWL